MAEIILKDEAYAIIGSCFEVYNQLGCGFLESVYQEALEIELRARGIPFVSQPEIAITYKGEHLKQAYRADLICYDQILLELKSCKALADDHRSQTLNYLHATKLPLALLINFGHANDLQYERFLPRN